MTSEKLSATVDADLLAAVRSRVGPRGLSSFVGEALRHQLRRVEFHEFLAELDGELGPVDGAAVDKEVAAIERDLERAARRAARRTSVA